MGTTLFFASSCKEDDVVVDLRDNVVGTYNYNLKSYVFDGTNLTYLGADTDETGTMIVKKNATNAATLDFFEGAELQFQGNKIQEASNAVAFDIPSQTMTKDGITVDIRGFEYWDLGGTKYHGAYVTADKQISAAFQYTITVGGESVTFVATYEGTKQ